MVARRPRPGLAGLGVLALLAGAACAQEEDIRRGARAEPAPIDDVAFDPPPEALALLGGKTYAVAHRDGTIKDTSRDRDIAFRWRYPLEAAGDTPLILISHGGYGSDRGYTAYPHLGSTYARLGFITLTINHLRSANEQRHRYDRAVDVSFIIDVLLANNWQGTAVGDKLPPPADFSGTIDFRHIGLTGHSFGGFTANAIAGADHAPTMGIRNFRDPRVRAVVPISAQGEFRFGTYDYGPEENSWAGVSIPVYALAGAAEGGNDWRRTAFDRYPPVGDKFYTVGAGQGHAQMGNSGSDEVRRLIAWNTALFFHAYLRAPPDEAKTLRCRIGTLAWLEGWTLERKLDPQAGPACN